MNRFCCSVATFSCTVVLAATPLQALEKLGKPIGPWSIERSVDQMSDEKSCTAYYGENIQLSTEGFAVGYRTRGGIEGYEIRIDEQPASGMILPDKYERQIGAIVLRRPILAKILSSKRVRIKALTRSYNSVIDDIDMSALPKVLTVLNGPDCS